MDDLAFSGPIPLTGLDREISQVLRQFGYQINLSKRRVWGPSDRHTVTGIVVDTTLNPTPEFLRDLTRLLIGLNDGDCRLTATNIVGKINWVTSLNPVLGAALRRRFRAAHSAKHTAVEAPQC
jgi:hypothetical protein